MIPKIKATNVFSRNYSSDKRIVINRGGTRSSKTFSIMQQFWLWLLTGQIRQNLTQMSGIASIVRKTLPALKKTAYRDFLKFLHDTKTYQFIEHNKSDYMFKYQDRIVEFVSIDDPQKARGAGRDFLWCVEGNELDYDNDFFQLFIRTTGFTVIDFNPDDEYIWINEELEQKRAVQDGDVDIIVSTHWDNNFLPQVVHDEIERLMHANPSYYKIYGLGEYGTLEGVIFKYKAISYAEIADMPVYSYGLDFGYSNDPAALIEIRKDERNKKLYLHELIYETGLLNADLIHIFDTFNLSKSIQIIADSAEPKSIEEIKKAGYNCIGAVKGGDSVKFGIDRIMSYEIFITSSSPNMTREGKRYIWQIGKDGKPTNKPVDRDNHGWDATRYGLSQEETAPLVFYA